ncbi:YciI family protein [uncultured Rhodospira sp.]|uniref:YciI family protein n=1 Tax=uncultured Rhodospira sp. TaxID=1936189 RepID=UPI00260EC7EE|nr:YciI family protein [uncultured Rhodospira sp.]
MLWMINCVDVPNSAPIRAAHRDAHLTHLDAHADHLVMAGPLQNDARTSSIGSLLVVEFPDRDSVVAFAQGDPFNRAGVFASVTICPFRRTLPLDA